MEAGFSNTDASITADFEQANTSQNYAARSSMTAV
jgi:hypothetical protein